MPTLRTRAAKTSALTHNELDANFVRTVTQKTDSYQILLSDNRSIIEANKATATTMTLPPVATADNSETGDFEVTITNIGAGVSTVDGSGAEAVDGGTGFDLPQWASATFQLDSAQTGWKTISKIGGVGAFTTLTGDTIDGALGSVTPAAVVATTLTLDSIAQPAIKIVDIGDWNMDSTNNVNVAHGLTHTDIRAVSCLIRNDSDANSYDFVGQQTTGHAFTIDATNIGLQRQSSGFFDSTDFDATTYNRGWITITYV